MYKFDFRPILKTSVVHNAATVLTAVDNIAYLSVQNTLHVWNFHCAVHFAHAKEALETLRDRSIFHSKSQQTSK